MCRNPHLALHGANSLYIVEVVRLYVMRGLLGHMSLLEMRTLSSACGTLITVRKWCASPSAVALQLSEYMETVGRN